MRFISAKNTYGTLIFRARGFPRFAYEILHVHSTIISILLVFLPICILNFIFPLLLNCHHTGLKSPIWLLKSIDLLFYFIREKSCSIFALASYSQPRHPATAFRSRIRSICIPSKCPNRSPRMCSALLTLTSACVSSMVMHEDRVVGVIFLT